MAETGTQAVKARFEELVKTIADKCKWKTRRLEDGSHLLDIETDAGRRQKVTVSQDEDIAGQPIARYWSIIGPADTLNYRQILEENANLDYGTFAIQHDKLVIMDTQLLEDADPLEVGTTISYLASYADRYEAAIFGVDEY